jgi:hypothetical protein
MNKSRWLPLVPTSLVLFCCPNLLLKAQTPVPAAGSRDAAAISIIDKALLAMGGKSAIQSVQTVLVTGSITEASDGSVVPFRLEELIAGSHFEFRKETTRGSTIRVFASGHGNPGYQGTGSLAKPLSGHMASAAPPFEFPAILLLAEEQDPNYSITLVAASSGDPAHVHITNASDPILNAVIKQEWYFDPNTGLPELVMYLIPSSADAFDSMHGSCGYSGFQTIGGVQFPSQLIAYQDGIRIAQVMLGAVIPNQTINPSDFDLPAATQ